MRLLSARWALVAAGLAAACAGGALTQRGTASREAQDEAGLDATASSGETPAPVASRSEAETHFAEEVAPILARRCDPCHNPGGKMYAELPFDDPATVLEHRSGILRRLSKSPEDRARLERWIGVASAPGS